MSPSTQQAPASDATVKGRLSEPTRNDRYRDIKWEWDICEAGKGKRRLAVLSVSHSTQSGRFSATLVNEDVDGRSRTVKLFSGHAIDQEPIARFSQKRLEAFADRALEKLRASYEAKDADVLPYFQPEA